MTGKQKCLADAVARDADAVGSRRAGRAPEPLQVTQVTQLRHFCLSDASDGFEHLLVESQANTNTSDRFSTTHNTERCREDEQRRHRASGCKTLAASPESEKRLKR